ncbi:MAG: hypothetical protein ACSLE1_02920 [Sphingobium sp.]
MNLSLNLSSLKKLGYGDRVRPSRDWFVLLAIACVLVGASIGWNVLLYKTAERGGAIGDERLPEPFDAAPIESVRAVFESRALERAQYEQGPRFVDPSL